MFILIRLPWSDPTTPQLETDPKPEDILVPYYTVRLMWHADDFDNVTSFHTELSQVEVVQ
jgi:hypothetical protein